MKFRVECIQDYITNKGERIFVNGEIYDLVIGNIAAKVMYDNDNGTVFVNGLDEHFKPHNELIHKIND